MENKISVRAGRLSVALEWNEKGISGVSIEGVEGLLQSGGTPSSNDATGKTPGFVSHACRTISTYGKNRFDFNDITVDIQRLTTFQKKVFKELVRIPSGKVASYSWLARRVGDPRAARAVAGALARNPMPLVYPCHRVVGKDRTLHGFSARGGVKTKRYLLDLEGVTWEPDGTVSPWCMID
jgi:methylated-DNA-[protein]-cysteine S-methyltransferase